MTNSLRIAAALASAAALLVAGCTASDGRRAVDGSVTVAIAFSGDQRTALTADLTTWGRKHGVHVQVVDSPTGAHGADADLLVVDGVRALRELPASDGLPLQDLIDVPSVVRDMPNGLAAAGITGGRQRALPIDVDVDSVVWYDPVAFDQAALDVPTTDDELRRISGLIVDEDSGFPWCQGTAGGDHQGATLVDWLGEYVLRYGGLEQYDRWLRHELPFNAPIVRRAAEKVYGLLLRPGQVEGGGPAIARTTPARAGTGLFADDKAAGRCFMLHATAGTAGGLPPAVADRARSAGTSALSAFPLPTPTGATPSVTGDADFVMARRDGVAVRGLLAYLVGTGFGSNGYRSGWTAAVSPYRGGDGALALRTEQQKASAAAVSRARAFGFSASVLLPVAATAGSELTKWAQQHKTIDAALKAVEVSW